MEALPRLRYIDAFPVDVDGQRLIYLRDPEGIAAEGLGVPPPVFQFMTLLDGTRTIEDLKAATVPNGSGETVSDDQINDLLKSLDESYLLDSERYRERKAEVASAYREEKRRPSALAGRSFPEKKDALELLIDSFFTDQTGPDDSPRSDAPVTALVAPHIDFGRGGPCFAWAYNELKSKEPADVYVVFGTGHSAKNPFTTSRKTFETPLGDLEADQRFIDQLVENCEQDLFDDELAHKNEHSIEFQVVFLKYLFPDVDITFVPILCGSFYESVHLRRSPMEDPRVADFVQGLRRAIDADDRRICLISGVDFSHVGRRFGDDNELDDAFLDRVRSSDVDLIDAASDGDPEKFFDVIVRDCDRNRVCGTSSIYTMLKVMDGQRGELLKYDQAADYESQQMVSFASMAWYERSASNDK